MNSWLKLLTMLAQVHSFVLAGIDPSPCEIEVDVADVGLPKTTVVGLADTAVKEALERVRSAMENGGYGFPMARLLVNLAPADVRKEGNVYDLPIAVGLLLTQQVVQTDRHRRFLFAGELALDGRLRPVSGVVNLALLAKTLGMEGVVVPEANAAEATAVAGIDVYGMDSLAGVVGFLNGSVEAQPAPRSDLEDMLTGAEADIDFAEVRGQEAVKRALCIAAAGGHNVLIL